MNTTQIRYFEEAAVSGLPPLRVDVLDGWLLRFADGYSRRANSVAPLYAGTGDVAAKIEQCEQAYARFHQPCLFKMTAASQPADLDRTLEQRGYERDADTLVCVSQLEPIAPDPRVELHEVPDGEWFDTWQRLAGSGAEAGIFGRLLAATPSPAVYALVCHQGRGVACGRATLAGQTVGLYDLRVDEGHRRQGLATALTQARMAWAAEQGAATAFLQVMADNEAAQRMQARLGFAELYRYWYRIQPGGAAAERC